MRTEEGIWIKPLDKYTARALELTCMENCNPSTSPKLDKPQMEGDEVELSTDEA